MKFFDGWSLFEARNVSKISMKNYFREFKLLYKEKVIIGK